MKTEGKKLMSLHSILCNSQNFENFQKLRRKLQKSIISYVCCCCCCCCITSVVSDSVRPHRWQPTRLPRPWDSPGKNTGVGCHFLLQCMHAKSLQSCPTLCDPMDSSPPGKNTGVGCHCLLQSPMYTYVYISSLYIFILL